MSRSTLGIVIGGLNVTMYIIVSSFLLYSLTQIGQEKGTSESADLVIGVVVVTLVLCLTMAIISGLLIMGIIKNRYKLMAPWVYFTIVGIVFSTVRLIGSFFRSNVNNNVFGTIVMIVIQAAIWYPIYILYKDIRSQNIDGSTPSPPPSQQQPLMVLSNSSHPTNPNYEQVPQKA